MCRFRTPPCLSPLPSAALRLQSASISCWCARLLGPASAEALRARDGLDGTLATAAAALREVARARGSAGQAPLTFATVFPFSTHTYLLRHLLGADMPTLRRLPEEAIVVARSMGPAELLDYDRTRLKGLVLEEGSQNAHVAIVARALDIPVIGRCADLMQKVGDGDQLVIDGDNRSEEHTSELQSPRCISYAVSLDRKSVV